MCNTAEMQYKLYFAVALLLNKLYNFHTLCNKCLYQSAPVSRNHTIDCVNEWSNWMRYANEKTKLNFIYLSSVLAIKMWLLTKQYNLHTLPNICGCAHACKKLHLWILVLSCHWFLMICKQYILHCLCKRCGCACSGIQITSIKWCILSKIIIIEYFYIEVDVSKWFCVTLTVFVDRMWQCMILRTPIFTVLEKMLSSIYESILGSLWLLVNA